MPPTLQPGGRFPLWRAATFPVIPAPPTVIPAQAGIQTVRSHSPSFRHKPESRRVVTFPVIPPQAGIQGVWSHSPSFQLPQPSSRLPQPSFRRKPESMACGTFPVIPPQAGIYGVRHIPRHSGASRNLGRAVTFTVTPASPTVIPTPPAVIPAQAGIYACRLHYNSSR